MDKLYRWSFSIGSFGMISIYYNVNSKKAIDIFNRLKKDTDFFNLIEEGKCVVIEENKILITDSEKFENENYNNILPF